MIKNNFKVMFGKDNPKWSGNKYCPVCNKEMIGWKIRKNDTCSVACANTLKVHIGESHPRWQGKKCCAICKKELIGYKARKQKTCSKGCDSINRSKMHSGSLGSKWREGHNYCRLCGKEIIGKGRWRKKCCSRKCSAKWQTIHYSRENSKLWEGGSSYSFYPPEFNAKLRREIRKRDEYHCVICHKKQHSLDVHHIDKDKQNHAKMNLVSLCRSCHKKLHWGTVAIPEQTIGRIYEP